MWRLQRVLFAHFLLRCKEHLHQTVHYFTCILLFIWMGDLIGLSITFFVFLLSINGRNTPIYCKSFKLQSESYFRFQWIIQSYSISLEKFSLHNQWTFLRKSHWQTVIRCRCVMCYDIFDKNGGVWICKLSLFPRYAWFRKLTKDAPWNESYGKPKTTLKTKVTMLTMYV